MPKYYTKKNIKKLQIYLQKNAKIIDTKSDSKTDKGHINEPQPN